MVYKRPRELRTVELRYKVPESKKFVYNIAKEADNPLGRIAILKSLILSKRVHLWLLLPDPPDTFIEDLQKMIFRFVWNRKRNRISRDTAVKHIADGGLGIPQIKSFMNSLKLTWIKTTTTKNYKS